MVVMTGEGEQAPGRQSIGKKAVAGKRKCFSVLLSSYFSYCDMPGNQHCGLPRRACVRACVRVCVCVCWHQCKMSVCQHEWEECVHVVATWKCVSFSGCQHEVCVKLSQLVVFLAEGEIVHFCASV